MKTNVQLLDELIEATEGYSSKVNSLIDTKEQVSKSFNNIVIDATEDRDYDCQLRLELIYLHRRMVRFNRSLVGARHKEETKNLSL